jgi:hypothetical protein
MGCAGTREPREIKLDFTVSKSALVDSALPNTIPLSDPKPGLDSMESPRGFLIRNAACESYLDFTPRCTTHVLLDADTVSLTPRDLPEVIGRNYLTDPRGADSVFQGVLREHGNRLQGVDLVQEERPHWSIPLGFAAVLSSVVFTAYAYFEWGQSYFQDQSFSWARPAIPGAAALVGGVAYGYSVYDPTPQRVIIRFRF